VLLWEEVHAEAFRNTLLHPRRGFGCCPGTLRHRPRHIRLCRRLVGSIENGPEVFRHFLAHRFAGNLLACILLQVELTPLPGHAPEYGATCIFLSDVSVADHQLHALHASCHKVFEKGPQVDFGFAPRDREPQDLPFPVFPTPLAIRTAASSI
jgi:hypothetical protein